MFWIARPSLPRSGAQRAVTGILRLSARQGTSRCRPGACPGRTKPRRAQSKRSTAALSGSLFFAGELGLLSHQSLQSATHSSIDLQLAQRSQDHAMAKPAAGVTMQCQALPSAAFVPRRNSMHNRHGFVVCTQFDSFASVPRAVL